MKVNSEQFKAALTKAALNTISSRIQLHVGQGAIELMIARTKAGINGTGGRFKAYSTKPCYIPLHDAGMVRPKSGIKTPRTKGKTTRYNNLSGARESSRAASTLRKSTRGGRSMYFPGGYKQYHSADVGSATVNLSNTGTMLSRVRAIVKTPRIVVLTITDDSVIPRHHGTDEKYHWFAVGHIAKEAAALQAAWVKANGK